MALTPEQERFAELVARGSGLEQATVRTWVLAEGGRGGNPLNIMGWDAGGRRFVRDFGSPEGAARATVELLRTERYRPVLGAARRSSDPLVELQAIAASPWEERRYAGESSRPGTLLVGAYRSLYGSGGGGGEAVPVDLEIPLPGPIPDIPVWPPRIPLPLPGSGIPLDPRRLDPRKLDPRRLLDPRELVEEAEGAALRLSAYVLLTALAAFLFGLGLVRALGTSPRELALALATRGRGGRAGAADEIPF